jgi:serine protease Do
VKPSVVEIDTSGTATTNRGRTVLQQGAGSGWIMDANGTIVTNNHVIEGATTITVTTYDGKTYTAQVINTDPTNDLAQIRQHKVKTHFNEFLPDTNGGLTKVL